MESIIRTEVQRISNRLPPNASQNALEMAGRNLANRLSTRVNNRWRLMPTAYEALYLSNSNRTDTLLAAFIMRLREIFNSENNNAPRRSGQNYNGILNSIQSRKAFNKNFVRVVEGPNGQKMLARPEINVPNVYSDPRFKNTVNNYPTNKLEEIRSNPRATKADLIKFIMYAYYDSRTDKKQKGFFHRAYAKLTTRDPSNTREIPPVSLYKFLVRLNKPTIRKFLNLIEW